MPASGISSELSAHQMPCAHTGRFPHVQEWARCTPKGWRRRLESDPDVLDYCFFLWLVSCSIDELCCLWWYSYVLF